MNFSLPDSGVVIKKRYGAGYLGFFYRAERSGVRAVDDFPRLGED